MMRFVRRFLRSKRGSGTVFMVTMLPAFLGIAGVAIDAAAAYRSRNMLQGAADAASLAAALALPDTNAATSAAIKFAQLNMPNNSNVLVAADVQTGNWDVTTKTFTANGTPLNAVRVTTRMTSAGGNAMPTTFLKLVGVDHFDISTQAVAAAEQPKLWVALVLDNTGSMCQTDTDTGASGPCPNPPAGAKIAQLKSATHDLLDMLKGASPTPGDVQVAIIPFVKDVNVGAGSANSSWIDWSDWNSNNGTCSASGRNDQTSCELVGIWTPASCSKSGYTTQQSCQKAHGSWISASCSVSGRTGQASCTLKGVWTHADHSTWNGCIMDRGNASGPDLSANYDVMNTSPVAGQASSLFPAEQYAYCPQALMRLSYDWTALGNKVDGMAANGTTNQTIGLVWGWHAMSQGDPLDPPALPKDTRRIIILLSDGLNTQDRWWGNGSHSTDVDNRMALACANAKADGVTIYTVFVDINGAQGNSAVLQNCATDAKKYYDLTSSGGIKQAFSDIGKQIIRMRLVY